MSERRNHIDELFKEKLGNYEVPPPPATWQQLRKTLPEPLPYYQRPNVVTAMLCIALLIGSGIGYLSYRPIQSVLQQLRPNATTTQQLPTRISAETNEQYSQQTTIVTQTTEQTNKYQTQQQAGIAHNDNDQISTMPPTTKAGAKVGRHATNVDDNSGEAQKMLNNHQNAKDLVLKNNLFAQNQWNKQRPQHIAANRLLNTQQNSNTTDQYSKDTVIPSDNNTATTAASSTNDNTFKPANELTTNDNNATTIATNTTTSIANSVAVGDNDLAAPPATIPSPISNTLVKTTPLNHNPAPAPAKTIRDKKGRILFPRGLTAGMYYNLNNAWIFSPATLEQEANTSHQFTFGRAYAVTLGYDFNEQIGISCDWVVRSQQGQVFDQITYGHLHTKSEVNLTYTHFPLLLHYKFNNFSPFTRQNTILQIVGGMQYSTLKTAEINMTNANFQTDILTKHAWGFVAGVDYDVYLNDNYYVTLGLRSSIMTGATNGQFILPDHQTTNHLLVGGKVGFNYRFVHQ